jgi:hypothetical protein
MKRLLFAFALLIFALSACASHVKYLRNNPDHLSPGLKAKAFLKVWGEPDEILSYHDFLNKYSTRYTGKLDPQTGAGSVSGYGKRSDYTYLTEVWIYEQRRKILFLEKGYLVYDQPGALSAVWRLVGWESIHEPPKKAYQQPPKKTYQRKITYTITCDDGSRYIGDILDGKRHGQGTYIWPNGDKYVGEWINDIAIGGWFYKTNGHKVWIYEDSDGRWVIKK